MKRSISWLGNLIRVKKVSAIFVLCVTTIALAGQTPTWAATISQLTG